MNALPILASTLLSAQGVPHPGNGGSVVGKGNDLLTLATLFILLVSLIGFTIYKYRQSE